VSELGNNVLNPLEISRFSADGRLLWQAPGADIFNGPFHASATSTTHPRK